MKLKNYAMKHAFLSLILLVLSAAASISGQDFRTVRDGVEHAEIMRGTEKEPVRINLLRLDLTRVRLDVVKAMDAAIGLETTSSMATRRGALAAINAGFFRLDRSIFAGDAAGVLMIDGRLLSESVNDRIALGIINGKEKTEVNFGHLKTNVSLVRGVDETFNVAGINRQRGKDEIVLYTPEFNRTTLTGPDGFELIVRRRFVEEVIKNKGSALIPHDGFVLSINGEKYAKLSQRRNIIRLRTSLESLEKEKQEFFSKAEDITNGISQLVKNGRIEITWEQEKASKSFAEARHPRTAVAKLKDGRFLMVTVDGRQPDRSVGMSLQQLAELLLELGAADAINLDGGGSTTMFLGGKVVNLPSDKEGERRVGDALLVFPR